MKRIMNPSTYDFLKRANMIACKIRKEKLQLRELKLSLLPSAIRYDKDKVQTTPEETMSKIIARMDLIERNIETLVEERAVVMQEISSVLDKLSRPELTDVMAYRYISGKSFVAIAKEMQYSVDHVYTLHRIAGNELDKILEDNK